jgi:hypothetical protein
VVKKVIEEYISAGVNSEAMGRVDGCRGSLVAIATETTCTCSSNGRDYTNRMRTQRGIIGRRYARCGSSRSTRWSVTAEYNEIIRECVNSRCKNSRIRYLGELVGVVVGMAVVTVTTFLILAPLHSDKYKLSALSS